LTGKQKVAVITGAGISAESGLPTFRDASGLWRNHSWQELASPEGWAKHPQLVLDFYNERRAAAWKVEPNAAHRALAALEAYYDVTIVTQNVDALHERGGSTNVLHIHGELAFARGTSAKRHRIHIEDSPIALGDRCPDGTQLRPDIVWFGEIVQFLEEAGAAVAEADKVIVIGTSLTVYPAAGLTQFASPSAHKVVICKALDTVPKGYVYHEGNATEWVPRVVERWIAASES
jgi:NAD-dependent deacetylase